MIVNATTDSFNEDLMKTKYVMVDFWAEWCQPCKRMQPILETLDSSSDFNATIIKANVDEVSSVEDYGIRSIPTLIFFVDGVEVKRLIGLVPENVIISTLKEIEMEVAK